MKYFRFLPMLLLVATLAFSTCSDNNGSGHDSDGTGEDKAITINGIAGVTPPAYAETPVIGITETEQYTGTVSWDPDDDTFKAETVYTATITLTPKAGYTLSGVTENFFIVAAATSVANSADSGVVKTEFQTTGAIPNIDLNFQSAVQTGGISGTADSTGLVLTFDVDPITLTADNITVSEATKGALTGTGTTRNLAISNITVSNGATVTITITSPSGYSIGRSWQRTPVYRKLFNVGDKETCTVDGVSFTMVYVPGGKELPTGVNDDGTTHVAQNYWIGETEVTWELWQKIYVWATSGSGATGAGQYTFANTGVKGNDGDTDKSVQHPVTMVNWRDSMVWCNALTEWYNANNGTAPDLNCVYYTYDRVTPIRNVDDTESFDETAGSQDNPFVKTNAKGFRLLRDNEWELAARWRDDATNTVSGYANPYFTRGNSMSGATTYYNDNTSGSGEPGKSANDVVAVYGKYWNDSWVRTGVTSTAEVKSKGVSGANDLGLYDMSGNVLEWCYEFYSYDDTYFHSMRSGSWDRCASQIGSTGRARTYGEYNNMGFRFARTW